MSIFKKIIETSINEDAIRSNTENITNALLRNFLTKEIEYDSAVIADLTPHIVLTSSSEKQTVTDNDFNMEFSKKTFDLLTYINWNNVAVAGGSIVNILTKSTNKLNDIDLFIYDLDLENAKLKIDHIINAIKQKASDLKYVINIYVFDTRKVLQVQIILRLYDSLAQVLVGFDVDCCCVAYDGKNLITTDRGFNALKYRVNVANLNRRSPSYENRLIKYSTRGFDVVTNFDYKAIYNKLFFMAPENYGFTRLLEQELINNGQLKNIIFSNTLRFRQIASYTSAYAQSSYAKYNLEIKNVSDTENCISKYNATVEDEDLKFRKYTMRDIEMMSTNVMDQFTGSFNPITNESWINNYGSAEKTKSVSKSKSKKSKKVVDSDEELENDSENNSEDNSENESDNESDNDSTNDSEDSVQESESEDLEDNQTFDNLGRSREFIELKYNTYDNLTQYENLKLCDMSNFDAKCLAVIYMSNENDIIKIVENKNIPTTRNMYKILPVQLAVLLGRTALAQRLMKNHSWDANNIKDLIYLTDNDKLFTAYCNAVKINYIDVDSSLVEKYECEKISNNIHKQNTDDGGLEEFYALSHVEQQIKLGLEHIPPYATSLDITKLSFETIKQLFEKHKILTIENDRSYYNYSYRSQLNLCNYIVKTFKQEEYDTFKEMLCGDVTMSNILAYVKYVFESKELKKCAKTSANIKKMLTLAGQWKDEFAEASIVKEFNAITQSHSNLFTCMLNINSNELTVDVIRKLLDSKAFDSLVYYAIFLDNIKLIQKLIPKDELYVKLKYHYVIDERSINTIKFLAKIEKERQDDKVKVYKLLRNTDDHIDALNDGILRENYIRQENVFGMTPDDNIVAKMLLMFNKVFNKSEKLNEKDLSTLKNMRKSLLNIRRNSEHNVVESEYYYSLDLHNLFFIKDKNDQSDENNEPTECNGQTEQTENKIRSNSDSESEESDEEPIPKYASNSLGMPSFPGMSNVIGIPSIPTMPTFPGMSNVIGIPSIPTIPTFPGMTSKGKKTTKKVVKEMPTKEVKSTKKVAKPTKKVTKKRVDSESESD